MSQSKKDPRKKDGLGGPTFDWLPGEAQVTWCKQTELLPQHVASARPSSGRWPLAAPSQVIAQDVAAPRKFRGQTLTSQEIWETDAGGWGRSRRGSQRWSDSSPEFVWGLEAQTSCQTLNTSCLQFWLFIFLSDTVRDKVRLHHFIGWGEVSSTSADKIIHLYARLLWSGWGVKSKLKTNNNFFYTSFYRHFEVNKRKQACGETNYFLVPYFFFFSFFILRAFRWASLCCTAPWPSSWFSVNPEWRRSA